MNGYGCRAGKKVVGMLSEEQKEALAKALEPAAPAADSDSPVPLDVCQHHHLFVYSASVNNSLSFSTSQAVTYSGKVISGKRCQIEML